MTLLSLRSLLVGGVLLFAGAPLAAQTPAQADSLRDAVLDARDSSFIAETEERPGPAKLLHAEPLFIDLLRDLGARKGEREWNVGLSLTDRTDFDAYEMLIEYEWAPVNRLGLEVEVPFTIPSRAVNGTSPATRVEGLKTGLQWTAIVSPKTQTSVAFAYLNTLKFADVRDIGREPLIKGNVFNPFVVAARRWGTRWHTLIYAGPVYERDFRTRTGALSLEWNTSAHYMLPGTRNFVGLEVNKEVSEGALRTVLRPQMRLEINDHLLLGLAPGIPVNRTAERLSTFIRLIYEPGRRRKPHGAPDAH